MRHWVVCHIWMIHITFTWHAHIQRRCMPKQKTRVFQKRHTNSQICAFLVEKQMHVFEKRPFKGTCWPAIIMHMSKKTCVSEKRPLYTNWDVYMEKMYIYDKETYIFENRHLKKTHWLAMMMHVSDWDVSIWKKTCTFQKRRVRLKRDITKRPTDLRWWCICQIETYLYEGNPFVFDNKSIYIKRDVYTWKETYVFGKRRLKETHRLAMMMQTTVIGACIITAFFWKETSQKDPLTCDDDAYVIIIRPADL